MVGPSTAIRTSFQPASLVDVNPRKHPIPPRNKVADYPKLLVEINGEAGGLFSVLAKVKEKLDSLSKVYATVGDFAKASMGSLEHGALAAAQAVKVTEAELAKLIARKAEMAKAGLFSTPGSGSIIDAQIASAQTRLSTAQNQLSQFKNELQQANAMAATKFDQATQGTESLTAALTKAQLYARALLGVLRQIHETGQKMLQANLDLERSYRTLQMATGDGAASMKFVKRTAMELGLDLVTTAEGFGKLAAAAKGTSLQGQGVKDVFTSVMRASSAMGLSAETNGGILLALGQMMSKGKVMAEELRKQLGEHLPSAFHTAARAMGVTTAKLDEMLRNGKVIAEDFLPKFAAELNRGLGDAPEQGAKSLQAAILRLNTAWQSFSYEIGQSGFSTALTEFLKTLTGMVLSEEGVQRARSLGNALGTVLNVMRDLLPYVKGLVDLLTSAPVLIAGVIYGLGTLGRTVGALASSLALGGGIGVPIVAGILVLGGAFLALKNHISGAAIAAADLAAKETELAGKATEATRSFVGQHNQIKSLEETLKKTAEGSNAHADAHKRLDETVKSMVKNYPDLLGYLKTEEGHYVNATEAVEKFAKAKRDVLIADLKTQQLALERLNKEAKENDPNPKLIPRKFLFGGVQTRETLTEEWSRKARNFFGGDSKFKAIQSELEARKTKIEEINLQLALLESWDLNAGKAPDPKDKKHKGRIVSDLEHAAKLAKDLADAMPKVTLAEKEAAEQAELHASILTELAQIQRENTADEEGKKALSDQKYGERRAAILAKEEARKLQIAEKYGAERTEKEDQLQRNLTALEEGGLEKRYKEIEDNAARMRKTAKELGKDAGFFANIDAAVEAQKAEAYKAQVLSDMQKIRRELADAAKGENRKLDPGEVATILDRWRKKGGTSTEAANKVAAERTPTGGAQGGLESAIKNWIASATDSFEVWKHIATNAINSVENAFAKGIQGLLTGQMSFSEAMKSIWNDLAGAIIGAISQIIAKFIVLNLLTGGAWGWSAFIGGMTPGVSPVVVGGGGGLGGVDDFGNLANPSGGMNIAAMGRKMAASVAAAQNRIQGYYSQAARYGQMAMAGGGGGTIYAPGSLFCDTPEGMSRFTGLMRRAQDQDGRRNA